MEAPPGQITMLLKELSSGNQEAADRLIPLVYQELKRLAAYYMRLERPGHTLQPTAIVHEAYLRLVEQPNVNWKDRAHFFATAAQLMRHILVDYARQTRAEKRGGPDLRKISLDAALVYSDDRSWEVIAIDQVLTKLAELDPRQCQIVDLRFFAGLTLEEIAEVLKLSSRQVKREWSSAKAWLYGELARTGGKSAAT